MRQLDCQLRLHERLTMTVNTAWERELVSFMLVEATVRAFDQLYRPSVDAISTRRSRVDRPSRMDFRQSTTTTPFLFLLTTPTSCKTPFSRTLSTTPCLAYMFDSVALQKAYLVPLVHQGHHLRIVLDHQPTQIFHIRTQRRMFPDSEIVLVLGIE